MKLLMEKMLVVVKGKVSMLERRKLTKRLAYFMSGFVTSLRGSDGVHDGCSRIVASQW